MSDRDFAVEEQLFNIDESGLLNGFYIVSLLYHLRRCTIDQLATALYLFRFVGVTYQLLATDERDTYWAEIPDWEKDNLDGMLVHVLIEKYTDRFSAGLRELMARDIIATDEQEIFLRDDVREVVSLVATERIHRDIMHKAEYVSSLVMKVPLDILKDRIKVVVGDM